MLVRLAYADVFRASSSPVGLRLSGVGGPERQDSEGPHLASLRHVAAHVWVQPRRADHLRWSHPQVRRGALGRERLRHLTFHSVILGIRYEYCNPAFFGMLNLSNIGDLAIPLSPSRLVRVWTFNTVATFKPCLFAPNFCCMSAYCSGLTYV